MGAMFCQPGVESMMVRLAVGNNRVETWKIWRIELLEQSRCRHAIIQPRSCDQHGQPIVREPLSLPPAPIQIQGRIYHFAWAFPALGVGRWNQLFQSRPLSVCQIRGIRFPCPRFL